MNCKAWDMAIIVKTQTGKNLGKIVECVRLLSDEEVAYYKLAKSEKWWYIGENTIEFKDGMFYPFAYDSSLKPLRDNDEEDEIITLVGKPSYDKEVVG